MPLVRMIISSKESVATLNKNAIVNTLYFNVSGSVDPPDYQSLVNDLWTLWAGKAWCLGRWLDIRAYNMDDGEPRPVKAQKAALTSGSATYGVAQVALCLSYYADRNLASKRGRIYLGPFLPAGMTVRPSASTQQNVLDLTDGLAGLGGLNVDWSLWSPKNQSHTRITNTWVDDSWDIIRSRKLPASSRITKTLNG